MIIGKPKIGKTRAAFEAIKELKGWYLLKPPYRELKYDKIQKIKLPAKCRKVILFLDDLNEYLGKCDVDDLIFKLKQEAEDVLVLATCRIQEEFDLLKDKKEVDNFLRESKPSVKPRDIEEEEERELADSLDLDWEDLLPDGTPGSIVLNEPAMRSKYEKLKEEKVILHALKLLREATISEWEEGLVREVTEKIFEIPMSRAKWNDTILLLEEEGFIWKENNKIIIQHDSYLDDRFISSFRPRLEDLVRLKKILIQKRDFENLLYLGFAFSHLNELGEALDCHEASTEINPEDAGSFFCCGAILGTMGRFKEAIERSKRATEIKPDLAQAYFVWGIALHHLGRDEEAIAKLQKGTEIKQDDEGAHFAWGISLLNLRRYNEAIEKFKMVTDLNLNHHKAYYNWGLALSELGKYDEAMEKFKRVTEIRPDFAEAYYCWGNILVELERYEEAIEKYRKATEINPNFAEAYTNLGTSLMILNRKKEAKKSFLIALELFRKQGRKEDMKKVEGLLKILEEN
ncbi:MAG: tetratricopeptide repeat protein [Candidatus Zixiibacteriota bacterium]